MLERERVLEAFMRPGKSDMTTKYQRIHDEEQQDKDEVRSSRIWID